MGIFHCYVSLPEGRYLSFERRVRIPGDLLPFSTPHEPATVQQQRNLEKMLQNCRFDSESNCKVLVDLKEGMFFFRF